MRGRRPDPVLTRRRGGPRLWLTRAILWLAVGPVGALGVGQAATAATPLGSEFQVNTYTTFRQDWRSVGVNANGDFVVVWASFGSAGSDTDATSIQGQRYDASGNAVGSEFQVNTYTTGYQNEPPVARIARSRPFSWIRVGEL